MRRLLLVLIGFAAVGLGIWRWYSDKQREQLIDAEIEKLGYMTTPDALSRSAVTLGKLGPDAEEAIPALIKVLLRNERRDPDLSTNHKHEIAWALRTIGPASVGPLLNAVRDPQNRDRGWGIAPPGQLLNVPPLFTALGRMRAEPEFDTTAIEETLREQMLTHDCSDVRLWAARALGVVELESGKSIPYPKSPSWELKRKQVSYWTRNLSHEDPFARAWAAHLLGDNGLKLSSDVDDWLDVLPPLAATIDDADRLVREESAQSLHRLVAQAEDDARDVVPALIGAIEKSGKKPTPPWSFYQRHLYASLGEIGSEADGAVPLLLTVLQDKESEFRLQAAIALGKIGDADAIPGLISALDDSDHHVVSRSAEALGRFGPSASQAVPQLRKLLDDNRTHSISVSGKHPEGIPVTVRETVSKALRRINVATAEEATDL